MAASDAVPSVRTTILNGDVDANRSNSSAINKKLAGNINAITSDGTVFSFAGNGFFRPVGWSTAIDGVISLDRDVDILQYKLSIDNLADLGADTVAINVGIYNSADVFVSNLFGSGASRLLIAANSDVTGCVIGRNVTEATTIDLATTGATTKQFGNLNLTTLLAGYKLRCFIESANGNSKNFRFELKVA